MVLASDRAVRRLNARHRGRNKPTNVLTFQPAGPGLPGEIVLALGTVRREAAAAGRPAARHLAHLVVHGALHLRGPRPPRRGRGAADGDGRGPHPAPASACPTRGGRDERVRAERGSMSALSARRLLHRLAGRWIRPPEHSVRDSIAELVSEAAQAGAEPGAVPELDRQERALIANVLRLRGTTADDVMIPRADIVAMRDDVTLDAGAGADQARRATRACRCSASSSTRSSAWSTSRTCSPMSAARRRSGSTRILRRPLLVAPQIPVLDLLLQMRQARMHLALVVDEYGGIDGLVTIEDLVETITGDIADEHDEVLGPLVTERADGTLDIDARLPVEEFETRLGPVLTEDEREADIDTVGGLVFTLAGRVPAKGEVMSHPSGIEFRVLDADPRQDTPGAGAGCEGEAGAGGGVKHRI